MCNIWPQGNNTFKYFYSNIYSSGCTTDLNFTENLPSLSRDLRNNLDASSPRRTFSNWENFLIRIGSNQNEKEPTLTADLTESCTSDSLYSDGLQSGLFLPIAESSQRATSLCLIQTKCVTKHRCKVSCQCVYPKIGDDFFFCRFCITPD